MATKYDLPATYVSEMIEYNTLYLKGSTRTSTGNPSFTSTSSTTTYTVSDNSGENGLLVLLQTALADYIITASDYNVINTHSAENASYASFYSTSNQSISNTTMTDIAFTTLADYNNDYAEISSGNVKLLKTGKYIVTPMIAFSNSSSAGSRKFQFVQNSTNIMDIAGVPTSGDYCVIVGPSKMVVAAANDILKLQGYQSSGGALDVIGNSIYTFIQVRKVG